MSTITIAAGHITETEYEAFSDYCIANIAAGFTLRVLPYGEDSLGNRDEEGERLYDAFLVAHNQAHQAGIDWADREAEALEGAPSGAWLSTDRDAAAVCDDPALAPIANAAAKARWTELVEEAEEA